MLPGQARRQQTTTIMKNLRNTSDVSDRRQLCTPELCTVVFNAYIMYHTSTVNVLVPALSTLLLSYVVKAAVYTRLMPSSGQPRFDSHCVARAIDDPE